MKVTIYILSLFFISISSYAQLGIGISNPTEMLHVNGNIKASGTTLLPHPPNNGTFVGEYIQLLKDATISGTVTAGNYGTVNASSVVSTGPVSATDFSTTGSSGSVTTNTLTVNGPATASSFSTVGAVTSNSINTGTVTATNYALNATGNGPIPKGGIIMWSGSPGAIPTGWGLCDGSSGRPDLRGQFIVGYNPSDGDYNAIGKTGGEKTHTLSVNELPSHNHTITTGGDNKIDDISGGYIQGRNNDDGRVEENHFTSDVGGNQAHENRPPYYVLAYIIKL